MIRYEKRAKRRKATPRRARAQPRPKGPMSVANVMIGRQVEICDLRQIYEGQSPVDC
jgi:hypothetical protein